jgi:hypothetical protein
MSKEKPKSEYRARTPLNVDGNFVRVGDVCELTDVDAKDLLARGYVERIGAPKVVTDTKAPGKVKTGAGKPGAGDADDGTGTGSSTEGEEK